MELVYSRVCVCFLAIIGLVLAVVSPALGAHSHHAPAPAPVPHPSSDGTSIDQGVAYVLMLLALVLTYLIHPLDASSSYSFF